MIQISVHLAFCYTKHELFASKALATIYWMHLRVNVICIYFLAHKKNNGTLFLTGGFQWQCL